jgi:hypothetical protein
MSQLLINQYLNNLGKLKQVCGVARESVIREAYKDLLKAWGRSLNLIFIPEHEYIAAGAGICGAYHYGGCEDRAPARDQLFAVSICSSN